MCSKTAAKCFLVVFNSIFFLLGAAVLGVGIFVLVDKNYLIDTISRVNADGESAAESLDKTSILEGAAYALIAGGGFVFVIGFCGCCGALKESKCLLMIYSVMVGTIFALELAAGAAVFFYKDRVESNLKDFLYDTLVEDYNGARYDSNGDLAESSDAISAAWDFVQAYFECCGTHNYTDYENATAWNRTYSIPLGGVTYTIEAVVPVTCCKMVDNSDFPSNIDQIEFTNITECMLYGGNDGATNIGGCYDSVYDLFKEYATILMGIGIGVALLEIIGIVSACFLYCKIGKEDDY